jgi:hypothetical protein
MTTASAGDPTLAGFISSYESTEACNDWIWREFTAQANAHPSLRRHRDWVEQHGWGFGDRAFHYMWWLLLEDLAARAGTSEVKLLEIGVFKGQVLSLWALVCRELSVAGKLIGVSPLLGKPPLPGILHRIRMLVDRRYRQDAQVGNLHLSSDYSEDVKRIFDVFGLTMEQVELIKGLSQEPLVWGQLRDRRFDVVYIDGGHRYEEVKRDLELYAPLVRPGGYLVVDDAAFFEPGTAFFKGFESVSEALRVLDASEFRNVINVGHNRVYLRASNA